MKEFHKPKKMDIYKENKHQHAKLSFIERNSFISKTNKVSAFIYIYILMSTLNVLLLLLILFSDYYFFLVV